nr:MAG TPA: hypothetical protein [Caudoviricetes sp.]
MDIKGRISMVMTPIKKAHQKQLRNTSFVEFSNFPLRKKIETEQFLKRPVIKFYELTLGLRRDSRLNALVRVYREYSSLPEA